MGEGIGESTPPMQKIGVPLLLSTWGSAASAS